MLLTRRHRILIELLGGPLVATILAALLAIAREPSGLTADWKVLGGVAVILAAAYLFAGIPSVLCTIVMEVAFAKGLNPASWRTVQLAAFLGLLSGIAVAGFFKVNPSYDAFAGMGVLGLSTGAILGIIVRAGSRALRPPPAEGFTDIGGSP